MKMDKKLANAIAKFARLCYTRRNFVHQASEGLIWMYSIRPVVVCKDSRGATSWRLLTNANWSMHFAIGNKLYILILNVDDILLFADMAEIKRVKTFMMKEFQWITVICDKVQSWSYTLSNCYNKFLIVWVKECFQQMTTETKLLDEDGKQKFHTIVANVLYFVLCP